MEFQLAGLHSVFVLLRLCHHANSIRYIGQEIWCPAFPGLGHAHQLGVCLRCARGSPRGWCLRSLCCALHSGSGRGSHCALHARPAGQVDPTQRTFPHGCRSLCWRSIWNDYLDAAVWPAGRVWLLRGLAVDLLCVWRCRHHLVDCLPLAGLRRSLGSPTH